MDQYSEQRIDGLRFFVLEGTLLRVAGRQPFGNRFESRFDLASIETLYTTIWKRSRYFGVGLAMIAFGFALSVILPFCSVPTDICLMFVATFALPGGVYACATFRRIESAQFKTKAGAIAFDIAKAGSMADRYPQFVQSVVFAIEEARVKEETNYFIRMSAATRSRAAV